MAVVALSRMMTVMSVFAVAALRSGVMPEWANVESPMTETAGWRPTSEAPRAMPMLAPMQTQLWMAL